MNKLIIAIIAILAPACTVHVHEHVVDEPYGYSHHTVRTVVVERPVVVHRHVHRSYHKRWSTCVNLNPNVCRRRGY